MSANYKNRFGTNYREEYFRHHKGLFGFYLCSYCGKIMKKDKVTVDHVIPKSKFLANKVWDANTKFNLVAACHHCNCSKSNLVDLRIIQGHLVLLLGPIGVVIGLLCKTVYRILSLLTKFGIGKVLGSLLKPILKVIFKLPTPVLFVILTGSCVLLCKVFGFNPSIVLKDGEYIEKVFNVIGTLFNK